MLHPTKIPDCASELESLLDFEERLLDFAFKHEGFTTDDLRLEFGDVIATWLNENGHRQKILDPLKPFSRNVPNDEKWTVLEKFKHDRMYQSPLEDPDFRFELVVSDQSPNYLQGIKKLFMAYYEQLTESGLHPEICQHEGDGLKKKHWWKSYYLKNKNGRTCAACDASLAAAGETIDHYFPQSRYPALCVHPANLLAVCKICNSEAKKEKDPLASDVLGQIYLPYDGHISSEIIINFSDVEGEYKVTLIPLNDNPIARGKLQNFDALFCVTARWNHAMASIAETAINRASEYFEFIKEKGEVVDQQTFPHYLDDLCSKMERNWGKYDFEYVATEWLKWAKNNKPDLMAKVIIT